MTDRPPPGCQGAPSSLRRIETLEEAIRAEIWTARRLAEHACTLGEARQATAKAPTIDLIARARDNQAALRAAYRAVSDAARQGRAVTPAAKWLLDNFHVVAEHSAELAAMLPRHMYRRLPAVVSGPLSGQARVYEIANDYVAHTDSRFEGESFEQFVNAYQTRSPLTIRELWVLPVMLRAVLLENLRRVAVRTAAALAAREHADRCVDRLASDRQFPDNGTQVFAPPAGLMREPYIVQLVQRLHDRVPEAARLLDTLRQQFAADAATLEELVRNEHARQAANNLTVRNLITSLRAIASLDWRGFFDAVSLVDASLRRHDSYRAVDFHTRDRYRQSIEELARRSAYSEVAVAGIAGECVDEIHRAIGPDAAAAEPAADLGYFLIGDGRMGLEARLHFRPSLKQKVRRRLLQRPLPLYIGTIAVLTLALAILAGALGMNGWPGLAPWAGVLLVLCSTLPLSELVVLALNRQLVDALPPQHLPRLAWPEGVPQRCKTLVALPVLMGSEADVRRHVRQLETHANASPKGALAFALLTDWPDSAAELEPGDVALLQFARSQIAELNARYPVAPGNEPKFYLFHRRRLWNPGEDRWMAWERKRGKLVELNRLLRGASDTSFLFPASPGNAAGHDVPAGVRYVLTVDADTRVPMGLVTKLVGTACHPLNRARFDETGRIVTRGYAIYQPRVTPLLPNRAEDSLYLELDARGSGLDPYAGAVSDLYQDVFRQGIYTGKGLYEIDAFQQALDGRIPENALLSHDLFEGIFARTALVTDTEVFEEFPAHSEVAATRLHRWARGDWQLLPWLVGPRRRDVPPLGRWQILDNLRRSMVAPGSWLTLLLAWSIPGTRPGVWLAIVLLPLCHGGAMNLLGLCRHRLRGASLPEQLRGFVTEAGTEVGRVFVALALLAQTAWLMIDAAGRSLVRVTLTRRRMLEWATAERVKASAGYDLSSFVWPLKSSTIIVVATAAVLLAVHPPGFRYAAPLLVLWWLAPLIARMISLPAAHLARRRELRRQERAELRALGRRIWRFFESLVTPAENHLPPDNLQEDPAPQIAHRTSPTNIGAYLLSTLAARDLGWIGLLDMVDRIDATLQTLRKLERHRGHFYNWYNTQTLAPLEPRYVSTVDSGNLAGHLLTLKQAAVQAIHTPLVRSDLRRGPRDTIPLLAAAVKQYEAAHESDRLTIGELHRAFDGLKRALHRPVRDRLDSVTALFFASTYAVQIEQAASGTLGDGDETRTELFKLAAQISNDIASMLRDAHTLLPWTSRAAPGDSATNTDRDALDEASLGELPPLLRKAGAVGPANDAARAAEALIERLEAIGAECDELVTQMEFGFLFDASRRLFSIGYRVDDAQLDPSYYDLLASEARLGSFVAIAKGDVPVAHWFHLGRRLGGTSSGPILLSWSGSMFEYLMPSLVMRDPRGSLLEQTCTRAVRQQVNYGARRKVPWGISESAYNLRDRALAYQYGGFGVPGLGLKRGLGDNLVVAPYASALALPYDSRAALDNLRQLSRFGALGRFGHYEALDFTTERLPAQQTVAVVRAYMAHHQGMSLVAIDNLLSEGVMWRRFHADTRVRAAELILQEKCVHYLAARHSEQEHAPDVQAEPPVVEAERIVVASGGDTPTVHLLSNRRYTVMLTDSGGGYSTIEHRAVTRFREDPTLDRYGTFFYLRDVATGEVWSATREPTGSVPAYYRAKFAEDRATYTRRDGSLTVTTDVVVSPQDDAEIRRLTLHNAGDRSRTIEVTSYAELVLGPAAADQMHPAFSNLFIETERAAEGNALFACRRPRSSADSSLWGAHVFQCSTALLGPLTCETDRSRFLGRGRDVRSPAAVSEGGDLSNTVGATLDPVFALRARVRIPPGGRVRMHFATLAAKSRESAITLTEQYRDPAAFEREATLAWTYARAELHHLRVDLAEARTFQTLAGHLIFANAQMRASRELVAGNRLGVAALWQFGISGDLPIVLVRCTNVDELDFASQLLRAQAYWRAKGLAVDVVVLNEERHSYAQELQGSLNDMAQVNRTLAGAAAASGQAFVLRADLLADADRKLLCASARAVLVAGRGSLTEQLHMPSAASPGPPAPKPRVSFEATEAVPVPELEFANGFGGFSNDGREYVIALDPGVETPAPWTNVIANEQFGTLVTESGASCTWSENSRENQLTPWSNDPVSDPSPEMIYIQDEASGALWSPVARPIRVPGARYLARHGQGYSRFELAVDGIHSELLTFVAAETPVKISVLKLTNLSGRARRIAVTGYIEWCLGASRSRNAPFIVTEIDPSTRTMLARNAWSADFGSRVAFVDLCGRQTSWTASRCEFIGRHGHAANPLALRDRNGLSGRYGAEFDPCCAMQTRMLLGADASEQVVLVLGQGKDRDEAIDLIRKFRQVDPHDEFRDVQQRWDHLLGTFTVRSPSRATDIVVNRWLLYQALSCRFWGRAAFYQAGGAYGFRDQLQDGLALSYVAPGQVRSHLLRAAGRQFQEGDVQHWWHPPMGRGVRTHFSDDRWWLPFAVEHYLRVTGDAAVLDEAVPFIAGNPVPPGSEDAHYQPDTVGPNRPLYEHCALAIDSGLKVGAHGLPLIGGGDWNDGMNAVGHDNRGESVWLAWFQIAVLRRFAPVAVSRGDLARSAAWQAHAAALEASVEENAWDGLWYRRAFFDDGTPLGSSDSPQCRIDSIAQSWAVLSGAADPQRARTAIDSMLRHLEKRSERLMLLLAPPFDRPLRDPGYIAAYPPGIRENGGQYSHAATWALAALAELRQPADAARLMDTLNPVLRAATREDALLYKLEPYVMAADVYSEAPHAGRGGWSWYTGAAGWYFRAVLEWVLGVRVHAGEIAFEPCMPLEWQHYEVDYRTERYDYRIRIERQGSAGTISVQLDGVRQPTAAVPLLADGRTHRVLVALD